MGTQWPDWLRVWPAVAAPITTKMLFNGIYLILLILSGVATGIHARRRDRRILLTITLPWLLFFMLAIGLHERYLLFAAGVAAICAGYSVGTTLLGLILSLASAVMTVHQMFGSPDRVGRWGQRLSEAMPTWFTPASAQAIERAVDRSHPGIGWGLLVILLVYLYLAIPPWRRGPADDNG